MSTRHALVAERIIPSRQQLKKKIKASHTIEGFRIKPGYLYTVVRAISARVNQNYDGWPSSELREAAHTFVGKPCFVNHENFDPKQARGVVVASRYVENGNDKYIEVVQEIDAKRFPLLAKEIRTGGLDSVSMGAEAGFTICSACGNKAYDEPDMCDHVLYHKGEHVRVRNRKTGKMEDKLVYESCHKLSFFELSYVFDPADETAVASKVVFANRKTAADHDYIHEIGDDGLPTWLKDPYVREHAQALRGLGQEEDYADYIANHAYNKLDTARQAGDDAAADAWSARSYQTDDYVKSLKTGIRRQAGQCGPGDDACARITPDKRGLPDTAFPKGGGTAAGGAASSAANASSVADVSAVNGQNDAGGVGDGGIMDISRPLHDQLQAINPNAEIGGYRPGGDGYDEHNNGAMDYMTNDPGEAQKVIDTALAGGAPYAIYKNELHYPDGSVKPDSTPESGTAGHFDHVHTGPLSGEKSGAKALVRQAVLNKLAIPGVPGTMTNDEYFEWAKKVDSGEIEPERGPKQSLPSKGLADWSKRVKKRQTPILGTAAGYEVIPENSKRTQRSGTEATYSKVHDFFDRVGAPYDKGKGGVLDYGAGLGHSGQWGHTYEPHPESGFEPTYTKPGDVPKGAYNRITNLHVLNVVPPEVRHTIVDGIGQTLAPGGHAAIVTRSRADVDSTKNKFPAEGDPGGYHVGDPNKPKEMTYQKGFTPDELHQYVSERLGPGYTVNKFKGKDRLSVPAVHIIRNAAKTANLRSLVRTAALKKLGWGETEAPTAVDTLREEGTDDADENTDWEEWVKPPEPPEDDTQDFPNQIESPDELKMPDLDQATQIDREQDQDPNQMDSEGLDGGGQEEEQGNFITLKLPVPPQQGPQPQVPMQAFGSKTAALQTLAYFERYYGHRFADWRHAIEAGRSFTPEEEADFIRQSALLTLENSASDSTTGRNTVKGTANMARSTLATRRKTASTRHFAEGPHTDGGDVSRNDQGEQEEAFITETPPADNTPLPDDDEHNIENTVDNLVADEEYAHSLTAKMRRQQAELTRTANEYARLSGRRRTAEEYAGGPTAEEVNPELPTESANQLKGNDFDSADPDKAIDTSIAGPGGTTLPIESSLQAFRAFDSWLKKTTKKTSRQHTERNIKRAAKQFADYNGIGVQDMFPALGIALRQARKTEAAKKGKNMRKKAVDLETAAPDERVSVPAPVDNTTDEDAQDSQFSEEGFDNNAGKDITEVDLGTGQNFAPGQAPKSAKKADGILAIRCAEAMIAAGLEPNTRERKYALAREFEKMSRGLIMDRTALAERFAMVRHADRQHYSKVASGGTRGANQSPIPSGFGQGGTTRQASAQQRVAANSPEMDYTLYG